MAFGQAATRDRVIPGAVATLGVSDRVAFLRKTYGLLGGALVAWAGLTYVIFRYATEFSFSWSKWALSGRFNWFIVIALFMATGWVAEKLARSGASRGVQLLGLGIEVGAWSMLLQPILWVLFLKFAGTNTDPLKILGEAVVITMAIFIGLTATVFLTKKDFSFMRGALAIGTFAALGVILASMIFGFQLGAVFCGAMILLMAGYILFQTSIIMKEFPPTHHVAAALLLFGTVATLFWYVLQFLMEMNRK
ncbi:MAG TPA: Bax inhibitor-1 family protein [Kofleriaceae bacterium]|nr:Bax inhibitor-1 family protein [Kofleriaceae bacterium]